LRTITSEQSFDFSIGTQIGVLMLNRNKLKRIQEPPIAYRGAAHESERAKQPPLPGVSDETYRKAMPPDDAYTPYPKKPGAIEVPYMPYQKPAIPDPPYTPYPEKPADEIPYEPYKGI
jgi:hypothetical protein